MKGFARAVDCRPRVTLVAAQVRPVGAAREPGLDRTNTGRVSKIGLLALFTLNPVTASMAGTSSSRGPMCRRGKVSNGAKELLARVHPARDGAA